MASAQSNQSAHFVYITSGLGTKTTLRISQNTIFEPCKINTYSDWIAHSLFTCEVPRTFSLVLTVQRGHGQPTSG